jgi:hypothetical protein
MNRRVSIATVAGALLAAPLATEAQPAEKVYRIGFLALVPGEDRSAEGRQERLAALATELASSHQQSNGLTARDELPQEAPPLLRAR